MPRSIERLGWKQEVIVVDCQTKREGKRMVLFREGRQVNCATMNGRQFRHVACPSSEHVDPPYQRQAYPLRHLQTNLRPLCQSSALTSADEEKRPLGLF